MITLTIDPRNAQTLISIIDVYLDDLRVEIRHTDNPSYKDMLVHRRESLKEIRLKLQENQTQQVTLAS